MYNPLAQAVSALHPCPLPSLQLPVPSQTLIPTQGAAALGSLTFSGMSTQVPTDTARLQARQVRAHAVLQHTPSVQCPLPQSTFLVQALPWPQGVSQVPPPPQ